MSDIPPPNAPTPPPPGSQPPPFGSQPPPPGSQPPPPLYQAAAPGSQPPPPPAVGYAAGTLTPAPKKPSGLAITALILGIAAFLTGLVPVLGLLLGATAIVLGILALRAHQSKGLGITGIVLGAIAALTSLLMTIGMIGAFNSVATSADKDASSITETQPSEPSEPSEPAEEPAEEPEPAADAGTAANPLPQPYIAKGLLGGEKYSLTARITNASANDQVKGWNQFNPDAPAGYKYVVVEMTMTGIDPDGVEPSLATFDLSLATAEGNRYDSEFIVMADGMSSMTEGPTLYPGNSFTGYSAYIVPDSASSFLLYDNSNYIQLP